MLPVFHGREMTEAAPASGSGGTAKALELAQQARDPVPTGEILAHHSPVRTYLLSPFLGARRRLRMGCGRLRVVKQIDGPKDDASGTQWA